MAESEENQEITLESIAEIEDISTLSDEQSNFIREHADDLDDTQKETYKSILEKEEENEDDNDDEIDPDEIEIETRGRTKKEPKKEDQDDNDEDDELDDEDQKRLDRAIEKKLKEAGVSETKNQIEVDAFIRSKPEFSKYRAVALKYMGHSDYRNIPVHNIMAIVSAKDMQALGAQKEREAAKKAKDTQNKGTPSRVTPNKNFDWSTASKEDFEAQKAKVLGRQGI